MACFCLSAMPALPSTTRKALPEWRITARFSAFKRSISRYHYTGSANHAGSTEYRHYDKRKAGHTSPLESLYTANLSIFSPLICIRLWKKRWMTSGVFFVWRHVLVYVKKRIGQVGGKRAISRDLGQELIRLPFFVHMHEISLFGILMPFAPLNSPYRLSKLWFST